MERLSLNRSPYTNVQPSQQIIHHQIHSNPSMFEIRQHCLKFHVYLNVTKYCTGSDCQCMYTDLFNRHIHTLQNCIDLCCFLRLIEHREGYKTPIEIKDNY